MLWRPVRTAALALRRRLREVRWLSEPRFAPLLAAGSGLVGEPLERTGSPPIWADYSGAMLVPVRTGRDPERELLLKVGLVPRFRDRVLAAAVGLQNLTNDARLSDDVRELLPESFGATQLHSGIIVAVEERLAGIPLIEIQDDAERYEQGVRAAIELLTRLHRETRTPDASAGLARSVEAAVGRIDASGWVSPETTARLAAFAAHFRRRSAEVALPSVFCHGDFHHGNVLVEEGSGRVRGLLDFDQTHRAHHAGIDLIHFFRNRDPALDARAPLERARLRDLLPSEASAFREPFERYFAALDLPLDFAPEFVALYLLDSVDKRIPGGPTMIDSVRSYEGPLERVLAEVLPGDA